MKREFNQAISPRILHTTGLVYLASFLIPILTYLFILSGRFCTEDPAVSVQGILRESPLFRLAVFLEVIAAVVNAVLGVRLYTISREVSRCLALLGLLLKSTEVVVSIVIGLGHLAALLILENTGNAATGETSLLIGAFIDVYKDLTSIAGLFLGLGMMVFFSLLRQTNLITRVLATMGVLSYVLAFFYDLLLILKPECAGRFAVQRK